MGARQLKPKVCQQCRGEYTPRTSLQKVCNLSCALAQNDDRKRKRAEKERKERARQAKAQHRKRKEAIRTKTEWANEAQAAFNRFIRTRDWGKPCISCDRLHGRDHQRHASHYRSVKAAKQLRYNCWNVHTSCAQCNTSDSGNLLEYRIRLILKIGQERVEALESNHDLCTHDIEYYKRVKRIFSQRAKHYKKLRGRDD